MTKRRRANRRTGPANEPTSLSAAPEGYGPWAQLGADLAAKPAGPHRLELAMHVADAAAGGGEGASEEEIDRLATWFGGVVAGAIEATGSGDTRNPAAEAIWHILISDVIHDHRSARPARCPSVERAARPGDPGFVAALIAVAPNYLRTVAVGASPAELEEIRELVTLTPVQLSERYRPRGVVGGERIIEDLNVRRPPRSQLCHGVRNWAQALHEANQGSDAPPAHRIGVIAWVASALARSRS
jgi:hypothetical protein